MELRTVLGAASTEKAKTGSAWRTALSRTRRLGKLRVLKVQEESLLEKEERRASQEESLVCPVNQRYA
jgi:hypothetical protein